MFERLLTDRDFWQNVAIIASLAFASYELVKSRREIRRATYSQLHSDYLAFVRLTLEHPEYKIDEFEESEAVEFMGLGGTREMLTALNLLVGLWESAFLQRHALPRRQWKGWTEWIDEYLAQSAVIRTGVLLCAHSYDREFQEFVSHRCREVAPAPF